MEVEGGGVGRRLTYFVIINYINHLYQNHFPVGLLALFYYLVYLTLSQILNLFPGTEQNIKQIKY